MWVVMVVMGKKLKKAKNVMRIGLTLMVIESTLVWLWIGLRLMVKKVSGKCCWNWRLSEVVMAMHSLTKQMGSILYPLR